MAIAIALMCKAPRPGFAKTRLARRIGAATAARLAAAFIRDSAARALALAEACGGVAIALHAPANAAEEVARLLPPGFALAPQGEGDVGHRMADAFETLLAAGHGPVLLTGSDLPTLPRALLAEALEAVRSGRCDAGFVPVRDGGYGAVVLARPAPILFRGIAWSTPEVMEATEAAARAAGLRLHRTAAWYDIDGMEDLRMLRAEFAGVAPPGCAALPGEAAPATRAALASLRDP